LEPLMAASVAALATENKGMSIEDFLKVIKALGLDQSMSLDDALKTIKGEAPAADPDASTEDAPPPAGDGGADESTEDPAAAAALAADPAEEDKNAVAAATSRLTRITGKSTLGGAVEEVEVWRKSHLEIEASRAALAKETAALELGKRKENAIALTALGAETPHTSGLAKGKLCKRLLDEPLDEQTARVVALTAGRKALPALAPPAASDANGLSEKEIAMCARLKLDPAVYAKTRAGIKARSNVNGTGV